MRSIQLLRFRLEDILLQVHVSNVFSVLLFVASKTQKPSSKKTFIWCSMFYCFRVSLFSEKKIDLISQVYFCYASSGVAIGFELPK